ncbi:MAG: DUF4326 domain-containing protein [Actinomycetales bacterium]|nr:DUF4326 domain-containing protein [Actinomycetales bacterium]
MSAPKRIQMSRQHPWRADNPDAVIVSRPGPYGNPLRVIRHTEPGCEGWAVWDTRTNALDACFTGRDSASARWLATERAVTMFERTVLPTLDLEPLVGLDVLCWCALDAPCHGDPILRAANGGAA